VTGQRPLRRAVVLVGNPAHPYSRGLRIARTLASLGAAVEIAAVAGDDAPETEQDGDVTIRRYRPSGPYARLGASNAYGSRSGGAAPTGPRPVRIVRRVVASIRRWVLWPHTVRGWWATLDRELPPADLYHACGSLTIAAALRARARDAAVGRRSVVVYDAIDDVFGGNNVIGMPGPVRRWLARRERGWARDADDRVTVNDALATTLAARWGIAERPIVLPNWPEARAIEAASASGTRPDLIREATGLPAATRIVLFQGRLGPNLGLDEAAEAVLTVPDAALVLVGFGRGLERSRARDADPRFAGRHFTLAAVHPDELLSWTASADVALVPLPPISANQRASTPNKFWEAIAAGTPLVVGPDLPVMARLVGDHDLGVVASSLAPVELGRAIGAVLDVSPEDAAVRRVRIATLAVERFSWEAAAATYADRVRSAIATAGATAGAGGAGTVS
jgi:glycosyltransferase involved in cell wall biosynthesis